MSHHVTVRRAPPLTGVDLPELRRRVGLSQAELARRLGYTRSALWHWESGRRDIPPEQVLRIVDLLSAAAIEGEEWRRQVAQLRSETGG